jgi:DNA mismatch repair protein MutL
MGRIHVLDDTVINKIAAGEVVERPASVVKEMVENALDAGATSVTVSLKQGGTASIVVTDNGSGMDPDDAHMALRRHATSKISAADDLFCIQTMGFRGEALASMAAVSRFSLSTVAAGADLGVKLESSGGEDVRELPWSGPQGTTLAVEDLFFNVPARAKFLKAPATELSFCYELMQAFALCHPEVAFSLVHNGKEQLRVPAISGLAHNGPSTGRKGEKALRTRATAVLGKDADDLMYVTADSRYGSLEGLISPPGLEKATGKHLFTFVNGRWVKDKIIRYGVLRGYHSHILKGRFPVAILHLTMDPSLVDVNAHPSKTELRFQYPAEVQNLLALAIRDKVRSGEWAKAPDDVSSVPAVSLSRPVANSPMASETSSARGRQSSSVVSTTSRSYGGTSEGMGSLRRGPQDLFGTNRAMQSYGVPSLRDDTSKPAKSSPVTPSVTDKASLEALLTEAPLPSPAPSHWADPHPKETSDLATSQVDPLSVSGFQVGKDAHGQHWDVVLGTELRAPSSRGEIIPWDELHHVGTYARCFLLFECQDKLLVVDQHAFHERILFEKLSRDQSLLSQSQRLLVPEALDMAPSDVAQLMSHKSALAVRGFAFDEEGPGTLVVKAVPSILAGRDLTGLFGDLVKGLQSEPGGDEPGDTNGELARLVLATAACHGAVRAGEELSPQDLRQLLAAARDVDFVQNCPHGRRVFRWWTLSQVAGWFDR